jgi:hypothetical protein
MGALHSKPAPSPFEQFLQAKRDIAKSIPYTRGEASDFHFLCGDGKLDEVRQTLDAENAPSIDELNKLQPNGSTALHAATYYNHLEIVKLLLEHNCPRNTLNRFGNTAYEEAKTKEMRQLFDRNDALDRFHEINTANTMELYLPETSIDGVNVDKTFDYVHIFKSESDILEYTINQQTTAMWVKFSSWFIHRFRPFIEREDVHVDAFDLHNHPDFQEFLKRSLPEPKVEKTMESVREAQRSNSIEPLITLYTSEKAGFYRPLNELLGQSSSKTKLSPHLCDRFIIEFYIRRQELKQRLFTGTTYRGATVSADDLVIYKQAAESNPPGVVGLKAFTSTSRDPFVALGFAFGTPLQNGKKHVLFVFEIMEASPTIFGIDDVSIYHHEKEVLILPGNLFTVTSVKEQPKPPITKIYLKHWNTPISFWKKIKQTIRAGRISVLDSNQ